MRIPSGIDLVIRRIVFARRWFGVPVVVSGAGQPENLSERRAVVDGLRRIGDFAAAEGVTVALETHRGPTQNAAAMLEIIGEVDHPGLEGALGVSCRLKSLKFPKSFFGGRGCGERGLPYRPGAVLLPDSVDQLRDSPPQEITTRACLGPVLRQHFVEQDDVGRQSLDLTALGLIRAVR